MKPGTRVVMSAQLKRDLVAAGSGEHVAEFGECIGIVDGPTDYNEAGGADPAKIGPEVNVRWQPFGLRFGYLPEGLQPVEMIVAIDGPAASGKGTLARRIGDYLGFPALDTGLLYRAVARDVLAAGASVDDEAAAVAAAGSLDPATLDDPELRHPGVGEAASKVAKVAAVRAVLLEYQRNFAKQKPGAVLDGRDIGTVVCADADIKIFVVADVQVRAERRYRELIARGECVQREAVVQQIRSRDARDSSRMDSPMRPADDAILLDTTNLDINGAFDAAMELIKRKIGHPAA
jgi:CMP/dCMP kinase